MMYKSQLIFFFFLIFNHVVTSKKTILEVNEECDTPINCVDSKKFTLCAVINGEEETSDIQFECPEGYECLLENKFKPCTKLETFSESTSSSTVTKTTDTITTEISSPSAKSTKKVSEPNCSKVGAGKYAAPKCNGYYMCKKKLWYWSLSLETCPKAQAFDANTKKCVPIQQTSCKI